MQFEDIKIAEIKGGVFHPPDFMFAKSKEELAAKVQTTIYATAEAVQADLYKMEIDQDGDIALKGVGEEKADIYLSEKRITWGMARVPAVLLKDTSSEISKLPALVWQLFELRSLPVWNTLGIQLSVVLPFEQEVATDLVRTIYQASLQPHLEPFGEECNVKAHEFSVIFELAKSTHELKVRSTDDRKAIIVQLDNQVYHKERPQQTYPEFASEVLELATNSLSRFIGPILAQGSLDDDYLREGVK